MANRYGSEPGSNKLDAFRAQLQANPGVWMPHPSNPRWQNTRDWPGYRLSRRGGVWYVMKEEQ